MNIKKLLRLLDVAKSCRESTFNDEFCASYVSRSGLPTCAFGNYVFRTDLQDDFLLLDTESGSSIQIYDKEQDLNIVFDHPKVIDYFDITKEQFELLFSFDGCNHAETLKDAAQFIENFVTAQFAMGPRA